MQKSFLDEAEVRELGRRIIASVRTLASQTRRARRDSLPANRLHLRSINHWSRFCPTYSHNEPSVPGETVHETVARANRLSALL